jgi:hypothetical protein
MSHEARNDSGDYQLQLARNQLEPSSSEIKLRDALVTLATAEAALRQVTASRDELVRQYAYLTKRPIWQQLLFRSDGRPVKLFRRVLFGDGGKPRPLFRSVVLNAYGCPRRPFRQWMSSPDYLALPGAAEVINGGCVEQDHRGRPVWHTQIDVDSCDDAEVKQLMEQIRAELGPPKRS